MSRVPSLTRLLIALSIVLLLPVFAMCTNRTWDYVALGDSYPAGYGAERSYVDYYAEYIQADLGVQVEVYNYARTGLTTFGLLEQLRQDKTLRDRIREAEVITIWVGWNDFSEPLARYSAGTCGGQENLDCLAQAAGTFRETIDAILDEILALSNPQETLIRIADVGIPPLFMEDWRRHGRFEALHEPGFETWRNHLVEAAGRRGITVVQTYRVLNGPNGDETLKGIYQSDGIHFNDKGQGLIASLHREAGYEYAP
ncbi:MAG: SGNH/GDSL hydrolase family protein [Chloroflexota bacterium]